MEKWLNGKSKIYQSNHISILFAILISLRFSNLIFGEDDLNCKICHSDKYENDFSHSPAKEGLCDVCHIVGPEHLINKDKKTVFTENFPRSDHNEYFAGDDSKPNTYALCFQCHDAAMLNKEAKTTDTNFRIDLANGEVPIIRNLHWQHVTNASGTTGASWGRSCRICHNPHGASQEKLINSSIGPYSTPLIFKASQKGGTCLQSCHSEKTYQRK